ncbi:MAG: SusC/RagA family TonB-linked outer membrane protein, partial [Bacteroidota bacterium]
GRNSQWINLVGNPISSFYGFVVDEQLSNEYWRTPFFPINSESEDVIVRDLNGDGLITDADKTILGDPYPDLIWSFTNEFTFGAIDFSFMLQGSHGAQVKNVGDQYFGTHWQGNTNSPAEVVADGIIPHPSFLQERVLTNDIVQSADFFSLRNVNIGFDLRRLAPSLINKLKIQNCRVYFAGQNLVFITSDEYNGFNPEFVESSARIINAWGSQRAGSPVTKTYTVGLNLDF